MQLEMTGETDSLVEGRAGESFDVGSFGGVSVAALACV